MARLPNKNQAAPKPRTRFSDEYGVLLEILVELRLKSGMTQQELATKVGKSQAHVSLWERREREINVIDVWRWSKAVGVNGKRVFEIFEQRLAMTENE